MPPSPLALRARDAMKTLRDRLRARAVVGGWLEKAKEVKIGLHVKDQSYQSSGVYILPTKLGADQSETVSTDNLLRLRLIVQVRALEGDTSDDEPKTFDLTDIVLGILDDVEADMDLALADGSLAHLELDEDHTRDDRGVNFELLEREEGGFYYRAEVPVNIHLEVN